MKPKNMRRIALPRMIPTIPIEDTELKSWFERDREHIELRNIDSTILEFWDEDIYQLVEDGFLNPRDEGDL